MINKVRIISGKYGGRFIETPKGFSTHPMSERIKNALFNILGDITDLKVLDAYSGSGALGLEAVSRGAKSVISIEKDKKAQNIIQKNISSLGVDNKIKLIKASVGGWSNTSQEQMFDLIIADPPYNDFKILAIQKLAKHLVKNGILVISKPSVFNDLQIENLKLINNKDYGDASLGVYEKV